MINLHQTLTISTAFLWHSEVCSFLEVITSTLKWDQEEERSQVKDKCPRITTLLKTCRYIFKANHTYIVFSPKGTLLIGSELPSPDWECKDTCC